MFRYVLAIVLSTASLGLMTGCASNQPSKYSSGEASMKLEIDQSASEVYQNETVTFRSSTRNSIGHDAALRWETTGGKISTMNDGRIAQVTFNTPGSYTVTCLLLSDNREVDRASATVTIKPLR